MKDNNNIYPNNNNLFIVLHRTRDSKQVMSPPFLSNTSSEAKLIRLRLIFSTCKLQSVWIPDETLFQVFDLASEHLNYCQRNSSKSLPNFMINRITYLNLLTVVLVLPFVFFS